MIYLHTVIHLDAWRRVRAIRIDGNVYRICTQGHFIIWRIEPTMVGGGGW